MAERSREVLRLAARTWYLYLGGWSSLRQGCDAGLVGKPAKDCWTPFFFAGTGGWKETPISLKSDQVVTMRFWSLDGKFMLACSGTSTANMPITVVLRHEQDGWRADGVGCRLKRTASIAQVPTDFSSGSKLCGAVWSAGQIGSIASPHTFSSSDLIQIRTFDRLIPMFQTKVIRLRDVSGISETVSIENVQ